MGIRIGSKVQITDKVRRHIGRYKNRARRGFSPNEGIGIVVQIGVPEEKEFIPYKIPKVIIREKSGKETVWARNWLIEKRRRK